MDDWYPALSVAKEDLFNSLTADGIAAFPGIKELIAAARGAGLGVAIASSGSPGKIARNLRSSGLAGLVPEELVSGAAVAGRGRGDVCLPAESLCRASSRRSTPLLCQPHAASPPRGGLPLLEHRTSTMLVTKPYATCRR